MIKYFDMVFDWPEFLALLALIVGLVFALGADSIAAAYVIVLVFGLLFGRVWARLPKGNEIPLFMITAGCLIGICLGLILQNLKAVVLIYAIGILFSFYAHKKDWVPH